MPPDHIHFVYIVENHLRQLEQEFAAGITGALPGWSASEAIRTTRQDAVNVTFFIRRRAHIMMSHGVADKNYLLRKTEAGGLEINKYKAVCVPGGWLKDRLLSDPRVELSPDQIKVVGWPRLDRLLAAQKLRDATRPETDAVRPLKVLWAPTHGKEVADIDTVSSYPNFLPYAERLSKLFDFEESLHPNVRIDKKPTFEKLLDADVVIADRGTLVYEAWALGKPVIFPSWLIRYANIRDGRGSAEAEIFKRNIGLHAGSFDMLVDMLRCRQTLGADVQNFMESYLPSHTYGKSYPLIAEVVREIRDSGDLSIGPRIRQEA